MKNTQVLPFERNRYYSGKMLASSDFLLEQKYNGNKRRFLNQMMYGSGIVCGLSVYNLDDLSLMVDSGVAIDAYGREIVVENTVINKLSAIQGFDELETERASLCIRYEEEPVHAVYAATQDEKENEYNHIDETFELYLMDTDKIDAEFQVESEFLLRGDLIRTEEYSLEISVPAVVCMGKLAKILLTLTKHTESAAVFSYQSVMQMPLFTTMEGNHEVAVSIEDATLECGESLVQEIWVKVQNTQCEDAGIIMKPDTVTAMINGEGIKTDNNFQLTIVIADINPRELVDRELGKTSLEMRFMSGKSDCICLADISFQRTESGCVIKEIEEKKVKKYIEVPSDGAVRNEYLGYYAMYNPKEKTVNSTNMANKSDISTEMFSKRFSSGFFEIPLGKGAKKGDVFYSGEILHGLGRGDVYIDIGYENKEMDDAIGRETKTVTYGATGIFKEKDNLPVIETAVKLMKEKGTFVAGIRFLKDYRSVILKCRWVAVKASDKLNEDKEYPAGNSYITTEKPTIQLKPGETCFLPVKFVNMESCYLCYELMEENSGEVSDNGVYQAPQKEGVYEIQIYCENNPFICTYVYAVVKADKE